MAEIPRPAWSLDAQRRINGMAGRQWLAALSHLLGQIEVAGTLGTGRFHQLPEMISEALAFGESTPGEEAPNG